MKLIRVPLAGLLLALAGCMVVRKVQPAEYIPAHNPTMVWVTYTDNSFVPVSSPQMVGDTLKGTWAGLQEPVSIPVSQIQSVQAKMPSPKRTAILATVLGVTVTSAVYSIATAGSGGRVLLSTECGASKGTPNSYCCSVAADPGDKNQQC